MGNPSRTSVRPATLDDASLLSIGRIVRACAEIEDLVMLFICQLAEISESKAVALLGRTPLSQLKKIAAYLAKGRQGEALQFQREVFTQDFDKLFQCRNVVAHGVLLGLTDEGNYAFLTADTLEPENGATIKVVRAYSADTLRRVAEAAENWVPIMTDRLRLGPLRDRQFRRSLAEHRKGQQKEKRAAKPQRPPRSSQALE